jgi:UDP-2-acetamido-3-amino-2,3-dideoxy-glucuronate N-acetyltransferase
MISKYAIIENPNNIGKNSDIWHFTHVRDSAIIGSDCTIGSHCYIDKNVKIGNNCKIQSGSYIYHPAQIGDCVFIGPQAIIINDKHPKATKINGDKLTDDDWLCEGVIIENFASIGAGAIIMPGVTIGAFANIGAGSIVTKDVPPNSTVYGNPAK